MANVEITGTVGSFQRAQTPLRLANRMTGRLDRYPQSQAFNLLSCATATILSGAPETANREMIELGAIFTVMTFFVFILYGVSYAIAHDRILTSQHVMRWFNRSFAALFFDLGAKLAVERL